MKALFRILGAVLLTLITVNLSAGPFSGEAYVDGTTSATASISSRITFERHIRVATYNIAHARGNGEGKGKNEIALTKNLKGIADLLKKNNIDIAGLTEISSGDLRATLHNQPKYIAQRMGNFHYVYGENFRILGGIAATQGNAIISRFPIISWENHALYRSDPKHEQRGCIEAIIDMGDNKRLRVLVAHLSLLAEESDKQVSQLWELVSKTKYPTLLMGDFNSRPGSDRIKRLSKLMNDTTANVTTTFLDKPEVKIDYIFTYGPIRYGKAFVTGFEEGYSDHGCLINEFWVGYSKRD